MQQQPLQPGGATSTIGPNDLASLVNAIPISMLAQHHLNMAKRLAQSTVGPSSTASGSAMTLQPVRGAPATVQEGRARPWLDADGEGAIYASMLAAA
eukprot:7927161-Pyramimonas_sp.AAC.1